MIDEPAEHQERPALGVPVYVRSLQNPQRAIGFVPFQGPTRIYIEPYVVLTWKKWFREHKKERSWKLTVVIDGEEWEYGYAYSTDPELVTLKQLPDFKGGKPEELGILLFDITRF